MSFQLPRHDDPKNWDEDFEHENGKYVNNCYYCKQPFLGHKRRIICKECDADPHLQDMPTSVANKNIPDLRQFTEEEKDKIIIKLAKDVIRWQEEFNKAQTNLENLDGKKRLKVLIESEEEIIITSIPRD